MNPTFLPCSGSARFTTSRSRPIQPPRGYWSEDSKGAEINLIALGKVPTPPYHGKMTLNSLLVWTSMVAALGLTAQSPASDHIDGPVTTAHRVADLTDLFAFPTPRKPGSLSVILDTYPFVSASGHFTDKVNFNLIFRKATIKAFNAAPEVAGFEVTDEITMNCTFKTPAITSNHVVTCKTSNGLFASSRYEEVSERHQGDDFRLYAGMRSDPFFFNSDFATTAARKGKLLPPKNSNPISALNILTIVIEIDLSKLYPTNTPSLIAVAAETTTQDSPTAPVRRLDRIGRPEITNVSLVDHDEADLRDLYNLDRPFSVSEGHLKLYRQRLSKNLAFFDAIDGHTDWTPLDRENLARILADDYLVVDISKPCTGDFYLEIEKALLHKREHSTCGGRKLNDDVMDTLFTLYIGGLDGNRIRDGVDEPSEKVSDQFPYLAAPNLSLWSRMKTFLARKVFGVSK